MKKHLIIVAALTAIACNTLNADEVSNILNSIKLKQNVQNETAPLVSGESEANLLEFPEVVATVNGKDISRARLQDIFNAAAQSSGTKVADLSAAQQLGGYTQLLNDLIDSELLLEASSKVNVSSEDVDAEIKKFKSQFPDEASFDTQMKQAGMTTDKLQKDVREELKIRRWMETQAKTPVVSEAEAKAFYQSHITEFVHPETLNGAGIIPFSEARDQIVDYLQKTKQRDAVQKVMKELKDNSNIKIFIP